MKMERDWFQFKAAVNGDSIPLPEIYREQCQGELNIIAFRSPQKEELEGKGRKKFTPAFLADTTGFKFNREEANER
ncbi:MAG: hypothetical protein FWC27_15065 [Firmicutes bacterium]|nr:hypothetical protein [Bacillota bacterium]